MSIREFAAHLGVHERLVSKWEAGGARVRPRPVNQAALDTSLARSDDVVRARFSTLLAPTGADADLLAFVDAGAIKGAVSEVMSERELIMAAAHEASEHAAAAESIPTGAFFSELRNCLTPAGRAIRCCRDANIPGRKFRLPSGIRTVRCPDSGPFPCPETRVRTAV
ncbi:helix-turn-helix domain-containing protein, partial [Gordonia aichiensis]